MTRAKGVLLGNHNPDVRVQILHIAEKGSPLASAFGEWYEGLPTEQQCVIENDLVSIIQSFKQKPLGREHQFGIAAAIECLALIVAAEHGWLLGKTLHNLKA